MQIRTEVFEYAVFEFTPDAETFFWHLEYKITLKKKKNQPTKKATTQNSTIPNRQKYPTQTWLS